MDISISQPLFNLDKNDHAAVVVIASLTALLVMIGTVVAKIFFCRGEGIHSLTRLRLRFVFWDIPYGGTISLCRSCCTIRTWNSCVHS